MIKSIIKYTIGLVIIALLGFAFYKKVYIPKTTYQTLKPTIGDLKVTVKGIGNMGALDIYNITAQTGGKIIKLLTDSGKWVKKGDLLITIDGVDINTQLDIAKANLSKAKDELKATQSELKNQKAQKYLLYLTYKRYKKLKEQEFVSISEYDKAKANYQSIEATILATKNRIKSAQKSITIAQKNIEVLIEKISRLNVYSPIDGYVIEKNAQIAQTVLPSQSILKIVDPKTLWIVTKIDERISSQIKLNQKATIVLRSQPNKEYTGFVKRIDIMSDAVTLEKEVDIAFDITPKPFSMNEQAEVQIAIKEYKQVIKIPAKVVVQQNGKLGIWLVNKNHATFKAIEKIAQNNNEIAVSNIDKEAQIIIPNPNKKPLKEGMKIHL